MARGAMVKIPFNRPCITGKEAQYIQAVLAARKFSGDGPWTTRCNDWLKSHFNSARALVTTSGTAALEMAAMLCEFSPGDEVILPSFAFSSTANAFAREGASLVFVDIEPKTMNLDPLAVERAITPRTKAIVALQYAGVSCDMQALQKLADLHSLLIVEDAAQAIFSNYQDKPVGAHGTFSCISFHETKNIQCGEGGALIVNDPRYVERAEIILEKGTNRMEFKRGGVHKYTWLDIGSSYVLGDLNAAFLFAQLEAGPGITTERMATWERYRQGLLPLATEGYIEMPGDYAPDTHNAHIFWIKLRSMDDRRKLIDYLSELSISALFHYVPLHSSPAGLKFGRFEGEDKYTTIESGRLLRLPLYSDMVEDAEVIRALRDYFL